VLSSYKWPRIYNIVDSLPHTATGKIMHRALRKQK
jgi:long-chain acyl-CoA synthetase